MEVTRDDHDHVLVEEFHAASSLQDVWFDSTHEATEHQVDHQQALNLDNRIMWHQDRNDNNQKPS